MLNANNSVFSFTFYPRKISDIMKKKKCRGIAAMSRSYKWSVTSVWVFLVEVLLELWELIKVPMLLPQSLPRVAKLSHRGSSPASSSTAKTRRSTTIPGKLEMDIAK